MGYMWNSPKLKISALYFLFMMHHIMIFLKKLFICFWLCWVFVALLGLSLVSTSKSFFFVVHQLLIVVASLIVEHRLWNSGSGVVVHGLKKMKQKNVTFGAQKTTFIIDRTGTRECNFHLPARRLHRTE